MDWIWRVQCEENDGIFLLELWKWKDSTSLKQSVQGQGTEGPIPSEKELMKVFTGPSLAKWEEQCHRKRRQMLEWHHVSGGKLLNPFYISLPWIYLQNIQEQIPMRQLDKLAWFWGEIWIACTFENYIWGQQSKGKRG